MVVRCSTIQEGHIVSGKVSSGNGIRTRRKAKDLVTILTQVALSFLVLLVSCHITATAAYSTCSSTLIFGRIPGHKENNGKYQDCRQMTPRMVHFSQLGSSESNSEDSENMSELERNLTRRISRLEALVSKQEIEINRLRKENEELKATSVAFAKILQVLRDKAGRDTTDSSANKKDVDDGEKRDTLKESSQQQQINRVVESFDDSMIFGTAPATVNDAADAAGAAILAGVLGGKQRMLVDVRDAELSSDSETLVQFIELAILPIAAGLEGLKSTRNRVKIVFPTVSQLLEYRRTMALAAPEVVALSTLGFDPVERRDKLVVIVAPPPDDDDGQKAMNELLFPSDGAPSIEQPVVVLNYHMVPVSLPTTHFETAYHLRLLSVQYMTEAAANEVLEAQAAAAAAADDDNMGKAERPMTFEGNEEGESIALPSSDKEIAEASREEQVEAVMKHIHEMGSSIRLTRAMVIRSYPRPWHVFVDVSPGTDTDFEVAATFDEEPGIDEINMAIMECLEGSEREDELVAQQMQLALEGGQLDGISNMIGKVLERTDGTKDIDEDSSNDDHDTSEEDSA